jgi:hypothetical protein
VSIAANFRSLSGIPYTRQVTGVRLTASGTTSVNVEPAGSHRLDSLSTLDLRAVKVFRLAANRSIEGSVDFYNVTNANTVWDVRTGSGTLTFLQGGDPNGTKNVLAQFGSPASVIAPRIIRFNVAFRF